MRLEIFLPVSHDQEQVIKTDTLVPEEQEIAFKGYANGMDDLLLLVIDTSL